MEDFDAEQAKQIVDSLPDNELHNIIADIKAKAKKGETVLHVYVSLKVTTKQELIRMRFRVVDCPSIAVQKEGIFHSIYWG